MREDFYQKLVSYLVENQDRFYRLAFSCVRNQEDALDAVQGAVCRALEHYQELRNEAAVRTWFYRILLNESFAIRNRKKREVASGKDGCPECSYEERGYEIHDDLYDRIDRLEETVQKIIKLRFFEELTLEEIARVLGMNLNTVKTKLYRGLKILKISFEEEEV